MISGSINLAALKNAVIEVPTKDGKKVKGIFIPFEANSLELHANKGVYCSIVAFENKTPNDFSTHMVVQSFKKEVREANKAAGIQSPILGNLTVKSQEPAAQVNTDESISTDAGAGVSVDDLPFSEGFTINL